MPIKLIAIDLDETLLRSDGSICSESASIIRQARDKNVFIIIATSRRLTSVRQFSEALDINHPIVCADGALIMSNSYGDVWQNHTIPSPISKKIADIADENDWELTVVAEGKTYYRQRMGQVLGEIEPNRYIVAKNMDMLQSNNPSRILCYSADAIKGLSNFCEQEDFSQALNLQYFYYPDNSLRSLCILPKLANKGSALSYISERLDISLEDTMAIGDGDNDISMLKIAGLSVVMANARDDIKAYADIITASNNDIGVGKAIQKYVLLGVE